MATQRQMVLEYLKTHQGITSMEAFQKFGSTRRSSIIFDLRKAGHDIESVTRDHKNRNGDMVQIVEYRLVRKAELAKA